MDQNDPRDPIDVVGGDRMAKRRRELGYSRAKMAELTDISEASIKRYELGGRGMPLAAIIAMCRALEMDAGAFMDAVQDELKQEGGSKAATVRESD